MIRKNIFKKKLLSYTKKKKIKKLHNSFKHLIYFFDALYT
jgi:hypothetical protein